MQAHGKADTKTFEYRQPHNPELTSADSSYCKVQINLLIDCFLVFQKPLFENEGKCEIIEMKIMQMKLNFICRVFSWPRFKSEGICLLQSS